MRSAFRLASTSRTLNIGLTDATLPGLLRLTGNHRLAWDAYRRLIAGYGEIVLGVPAAAFAADLVAFGAGIDEHDLDFIALRELAAGKFGVEILNRGQA